jgi:hypothetical protein
MWRVGIALAAVALAALNYLFAAMTDMKLAMFAGAVKVSPTGWTRYSTPDWMFGSLLGPAMTISPFLLLAVLLLSGTTLSLLLIQSLRLHRPYFGRGGWLLILTLAIWVLRYPLPGEWTLYYHIAVRY